MLAPNISGWHSNGSSYHLKADEDFAQPPCLSSECPVGVTSVALYDR
jgi:hypothetical protein